MDRFVFVVPSESIQLNTVFWCFISRIIHQQMPRYVFFFHICLVSVEPQTHPSRNPKVHLKLTLEAFLGKHGKIIAGLWPSQWGSPRGLGHSMWHGFWFQNSSQTWLSKLDLISTCFSGWDSAWMREWNFCESVSCQLFMKSHSLPSWHQPAVI